MPGSPTSRNRRPAPATASSRPARSSASSDSRPTKRAASRLGRGLGRRCEVEPGSWRRIAWWQLAQLAAGLDAELLDERACVPPDTPRAPRPGGPSGTEQSISWPAGAHAAGARRPAPRARRRARRGGRWPDPARFAPRDRRGAAPPAARSRPARSAGRRNRRARAPPERQRLAQRALVLQPLEALQIQLVRSTRSR